uniref:Reverse transcriptase domain-containing protein n=1 Tax=Mustela putorius furo TaxID=9669 RepID=M3Z4H7_MUSPF
MDPDEPERICLTIEELTTVKVEPIVLPKIKPCFTPQYPIKGGKQEITDTISDLLKRGIIEYTQNFNSPVWPVKKPNGKWRVMVDYKNINKNSPKMPGQLPDIENITKEITDCKPKWMVTIDLSDMFFAIPLHPDSREITTFTWEAKQYQFTRVPQGYKNSPIIAHSVIQQTIPWNKSPENTKVLTYVDNIIILGKEEKELKLATDILIDALCNNGWTINMDKVQGPSHQVKFLGIIWTTEGPSIPDSVINIINNIPEPTNKTEAQHLLGLFGYWRKHIPYMQAILTPIYKITRRAADFKWTSVEQRAFQIAKNMMLLHKNLFVPQDGGTIVIDILCHMNYICWGTYSKREGTLKPIGFACKCFPYSENKYSLFEKYVYAYFIAYTNLQFEIGDKHTIIRSPIQILPWLKMDDVIIKLLVGKKPTNPKINPITNFYRHFWMYKMTPFGYVKTCPSGSQGVECSEYEPLINKV